MSLEGNMPAAAFGSAAVSESQAQPLVQSRTARPTWRETAARIRADRRRLFDVLNSQPGATKLLSLNPSFLCVFFYRIGNHLYLGGHGLAARLAWQLNFVFTGADISPAAEIGEGLVILAPAGTALMGAAGRNLTIMPCAGFGGEMGSFEDIGAGPGLPLLQDDILMEPHSGILGPIRVGNRVRVRAGVVLTKDAPDDSDIEGPAPRFIGRKDAR